MTVIRYCNSVPSCLHCQPGKALPVKTQALLKAAAVRIYSEELPVFP